MKSQSPELCAEDRIGLLSDAWALAKAGKVGVEKVLQLIAAFSKERDDVDLYSCFNIRMICSIRLTKVLSFFSLRFFRFDFNNIHLFIFFLIEFFKGKMHGLLTKQERSGSRKSCS